jgi:DNA-binding response OmpR family regulator
VRYGVLTLDADRHEVAVDGRPVELTAKEFGLLQYLLQRPGRLATRDVLLDAVWGYDVNVTTRTIDVHIRRLREKIPLLAAAILTVKPYGYKLRDEAEAR